MNTTTMTIQTSSRHRRHGVHESVVVTKANAPTFMDVSACLCCEDSTSGYKVRLLLTKDETRCLIADLLALTTTNRGETQ